MSLKRRDRHLYGVAQLLCFHWSSLIGNSLTINRATSISIAFLSVYHVNTVNMSTIRGIDVEDNTRTDFWMSSPGPSRAGSWEHTSLRNAPATRCACSPYWILNSLSSLNSHLAAYFLKVINCTFPLWKAAFPSSCWVFTFTLNLWFTKNNTGLHSPAEKVQISEPKLPINCQDTRSSCLATAGQSLGWAVKSAHKAY